MAAQRLSGLQPRMLQWVYETEAGSGWCYRPGYDELRRALGGNKGNMGVSLRNLEAKGLMGVYRTSGGQASTIWLTEMGQNRASNLTKVLIKDYFPNKTIDYGYERSRFQSLIPERRCIASMEDKNGACRFKKVLIKR